MGDVSTVIVKKFTDVNNGFLKSSEMNRMEQDSVDSLLNSSQVTTMVQVSGSGTKTIVHPMKTRPFRERALLGAVLVLAVISATALILLLSGSKTCEPPKGI